MKNFLIFVLVLTSVSVAQTIGPVKAECGKKCSGEFFVTNNGLTPLVVTVTPYLVTIVNNQPEFHSVAGKAEIKLSTLSARLSPKQTYAFDYKVQCVELPCVVGFAASMMTGLHTTEGMAVQTVLMHFVYQDMKAKGARERILKSYGIQVAAK